MLILVYSLMGNLIVDQSGKLIELPIVGYVTKGEYLMNRQDLKHSHLDIAKMLEESKAAILPEWVLRAHKYPFKRKD